MSEYITYLREKIANIESEIDNIKNSNDRLNNDKNILDTILGKLNNNDFTEQDVNTLKSLLVNYIDDIEINKIIQELLGFINFKSFLIDTNFSNPIKDMMLDNFNAIKDRISNINQSIMLISIDDRYHIELAKYQKYLSYVDENGFNRVLSDEERIDFYNFLKEENLDFSLRIIFDYIIYAKSHTKEVIQDEVTTPLTPIPDVNVDEVTIPVENIPVTQVPDVTVDEAIEQKITAEQEIKHLSIVNRFIVVNSSFDEIREEFKEIRNRINLNTQMDENILKSLTEAIVVENDDIKKMFAHFNISKEELSMYNLYNETDKLIKECRESIDDYELVDEINSILDFVEIAIYDLETQLKTYFDKDLEDSSTITSSKQYETGNSVILFFRKNENSKFLVEEDIEGVTLLDKDYSDIRNILKTASGYNSYDWNIALTNYTNFKSAITNSKSNGQKGDPIIIQSPFSHKNYTYYRLKATGMTIPRLSYFEIEMCDENKRKLGIPLEKPVILIIGETQVRRHNNETAEYASFKRELDRNMDPILEFIKLLEDPNTDEDTLFRIVNDSSDLYDLYMEKSKGLGA